MTSTESATYVHAYQKWRRGEDTRSWDETGLDPATIGVAIDNVLAENRTLLREIASLRSRLTKCQIQREQFHAKLRSKAK